jgi:hypothetical protein
VNVAAVAVVVLLVGSFMAVALGMSAFGRCAARATTSHPTPCDRRVAMVVAVPAAPSATTGIPTEANEAGRRSRHAYSDPSSTIM